MSTFETQYLELLNSVLQNGEERTDRTGTGTISTFGERLKINLKEGFPILTTKKVPFKSVLSELLWFIEGSSDERRLCEILYGTEDPSKSTIWTANANADYWKPKARYEGDVGRIYGVQWRDWRKYCVNKCEQNSHKYYTNNSSTFNGNIQLSTIDQLQNIIHGLSTDPYSRRHVMSAWNLADFDEMSLPPCHVLTQFYMNSRNELSCQVYMRSVDLFLGCPFNITSYALLTHMIAMVVRASVNELVFVFGDSHIYLNHIEQVQEQLSRSQMDLPGLIIKNHRDCIDDFRMDDFELVQYNSHPAIKAPMAV